MKILIFTEGGQSVGFGHITRCISLSEAIERKGIETGFIVSGDSFIVSLLRGRKYQIFDWQKGILPEIAYKADGVIIDSYLARKTFYNSISDAFRGRVLMIDDYNRLEYPKGIVVNPSICAEKINYPRHDGTEYLLGKDYAIFRKEFWVIPRKRIKRKIRDVLITFGGMEHGDTVSHLVKYLKNNFYFNYTVVLPGKGIVSAKKMRSLMYGADLCICAGGQTTYELARVGVPTIGICFTDNQRLNLEGWREKGFIEYIGRYDDKDLLGKIADAIATLIPYRQRATRSKIGRKCIDGRGPKRIVAAMADNFNFKLN